MSGRGYTVGLNKEQRRRLIDAQDLVNEVKVARDDVLRELWQDGRGASVRLLGEVIGLSKSRVHAIVSAKEEVEESVVIL